jgi:creatinine amidohydrolase
MTTKIQWMEMTPAELDEAVQRCPIAYLPVGSLEWHGPHLPLGTDSYRAEAICLGAAKKSGGVVLPALYVTAPGFGAYRGTITFSARLVEQIVDEIEREIEKVGFRVLVKYLGHAGNAQSFCFRDANRSRQASGTLKTHMVVGSFGIAKELGLGSFHAGTGETAECYAAVPEHVQLDKFDAGATKLPRYEGLEPAVYADGLPDNLRDKPRGHMSRTDWDWEPDMVAKVTADDVARRVLESSIEMLAQKALSLLKETTA